MSLIIIKLGTQIVIEDDGYSPAIKRLENIVKDIATLTKNGEDVLLVSSGSIGLGRKELGLKKSPELSKRQMCAALGQQKLMTIYSELFQKEGIKTAQILITASDLSDRVRYKNLQNCLLECVQNKIVPIINENDVVSIAGIVEEGKEKSFDDNDKLSSIIAAKLQADILIILTNVEGVFSGNPSLEPQAKLIKVLSAEEVITTEGTSLNGRGGMTSKLKAARTASLCGVKTIICSGFIDEPILKALNSNSGTIIPPTKTLQNRKAWIGIASGYSGTVIINSCTTEAFEKGEKFSLLPIGVTNIKGEFNVKDIISIQDSAGKEIARGIASISSKTLDTIKGQHTKDAKAKLLPGEKDEVIHRDNLVVLI